MLHQDNLLQFTPRICSSLARAQDALRSLFTQSNHLIQIHFYCFSYFPFTRALNLHPASAFRAFHDSCFFCLIITLDSLY